MLRKNWPNLVGTIFLLALALLVLAWWRTPKPLPPSEQTDILPQADIVITFSAPMQPQSVMERLILVPPQPFEPIWENTRTLHLRPQTAWPAGTRLQVGVGEGSRAATWPHLPALKTVTWEVAISAPSLLYLWPSRDAPANIYRLQLDSGEVQQLTADATGLTGYHASPDGQHIYYANVQGDLYVLDRASGESRLLLDCGQDICANPQVNSSETQLAFERTPTDVPPQQAYPQVWLLPLDGGDPSPLEKRYSRQPQWSPTGWLSIYLPNEGVFQAYPPQGGAPLRWENQTGEKGAWHPDGSAFVTPQLFSLPNAYLADNNTLLDTLVSHLWAYPITGAPPQDWSEEQPVEDVYPAISPDGRYLVFARKYLDTKRWSLGRQLWLRDLQSGQTTMLTNTPSYSYTAFAWSPDGTQLAYLRANQDDFGLPPEIWMMNIAAGDKPLRLVIDGAAPQWIP